MGGCKFSTFFYLFVFLCFLFYERASIRKEGEDISIGINANFLLDILKFTDRDKVAFSMSDPLKPVLMKPVGSDGYVCVIMPMRL